MLQPEGDRLVLSGSVTAETYSALREAAQAHVGKADLVLDWSAVSDVDSSAVALILSWQRASVRQQVSIRNVGVPESLIALVDLYGLTGIVALPGSD